MENVYFQNLSFLFWSKIHFLYSKPFSHCMWQHSPFSARNWQYFAEQSRLFQWVLMLHKVRSCFALRRAYQKLEPVEVALSRPLGLNGNVMPQHKFLNIGVVLSICGSCCLSGYLGLDLGLWSPSVSWECCSECIWHRSHVFSPDEIIILWEHCLISQL